MDAELLRKIEPQELEDGAWMKRDQVSLHNFWIRKIYLYDCYCTAMRTPNCVNSSCKVTLAFVLVPVHDKHHYHQNQHCLFFIAALFYFFKFLLENYDKLLS